MFLKVHMGIKDYTYISSTTGSSNVIAGDMNAFNRWVDFVLWSASPLWFRRVLSSKANAKSGLDEKGNLVSSTGLIM